MTSREYLLSQAEYCRHAAVKTVDTFIAEELLTLARTFEDKARQIRSPGEWKTETAVN